MRVTKIIREYVEKTIKEKIPYGEPTTTYQQHAKALGDLRSQLEEKVNVYAQELLNSVGNLPEGFTIERSGCAIFNSTSYRSPMYTADQVHQREVREKRQAAIENILVELELGATKADLERLIAEAVNK